MALNRMLSLLLRVYNLDSTCSISLVITTGFIGRCLAGGGAAASSCLATGSPGAPLIFSMPSSNSTSWSTARTWSWHLRTHACSCVRSCSRSSPSSAELLMPWESRRLVISWGTRGGGKQRRRGGGRKCKQASLL